MAKKNLSKKQLEQDISILEHNMMAIVNRNFKLIDMLDEMEIKVNKLEEDINNKEKMISYLITHVKLS